MGHDPNKKQVYILYIYTLAPSVQRYFETLGSLPSEVIIADVTST